LADGWPNAEPESAWGETEPGAPMPHPERPATAAPVRAAEARVTNAVFAKPDNPEYSGYTHKRAHRHRRQTTSVVQRLFAHSIPGQKKAAFDIVPQCKGEHTVYPLEGPFDTPMP